MLEDREGVGAGALRFKHLLVREVTYSSLSKADRAALHERFGESLEREVGDRRDEYADIFAHHAERAFTLSREIGLGAEVVGPRATRAGAWSLALGERADLRGEMRVVERALAVAERAAAHDPAGAGSERIELLKIQLLVHQARFPEARGVAIAARDAAITGGDTARAALVARIVLKIELRAGELDDIQPAADLARELSVAAGDTRGVLEVDSMELNRQWGDGRFSNLITAGAAIVDRALEIGAEAEAAETLWMMAGAARISGRLDAAGPLGERAREIAERNGLRLLLRRLDSSDATATWYRGDATKALTLIEQCLATAIDDGNNNRVIDARRRQAEILYEQRRYAESLAVGLTALAESEQTGERWHRAEIVTYIGRNLLGLGRTDEAGARIAEAAAVIRGEEDLAAVAEVRAAQAALHAVRGEDDAADADFRQALAFADGGEFVPEQVIIRLEHAEHLLRWGRPADAAAILATVDRIMPPPPFDLYRARRDALAAALEKQRA